MSQCYQCQRPLVSDEIAIYRKMVDRGAGRFLCKTCLAAYFSVPEELIEKKIEQFRRQGCLLFAAQPLNGESASQETDPPQKERKKHVNS